MEEVLQILARLTALLEQYDNAENGIAQLEMQNEGLYRMTSEFEKEVSPTKTSINKALRLVSAQREAFRRAIEDITGILPGDLRNKLGEIRLATERAGEYALEESKLRGVFEILVESNSFGEEIGESRADFENRLSTVKKIKEYAMQQLVKLVNSVINRNTMVGATDSVISHLKDRSVADNKFLITV